VCKSLAYDTARENFVREALTRSGISFVELKGIGFGIQDSGNSKINKLAKRLNFQFETALILDLRDQASEGLYRTKMKSIFIQANESNIYDLLSWKPSHVKTVLMHEIRHAFIRKKIDEKAIITPLSAILVGKKPDAFTQIINPYYSFLSFQEFATFALQIRHYLQISNFNQKDKLIDLVATLDNFTEESVKALEYFEKNIDSHEVRVSARVDEGANGKLRSVLIESSEWDISFLTDIKVEQANQASLAKYARERVQQSALLLTQIKSKSQTLRELLRHSDSPKSEIKSQIDDLNQRLKTSFRAKCETMFN
jgi:hypothetical protein